MPPEILAKAAFEHNIPFILSTVSTSSVETISEITEGRAWFQLYHPTEDRLRDDIIKRAEAAGCPVLVILCDVPTFGFRPRDIRNGLAMPPKMTFQELGPNRDATELDLADTQARPAQFCYAQTLHACRFEFEGAGKIHG